MISSNVSGVAEIVGDGKNGFLFEPGDENKLEELMEKAVLMKELEYENMALAAFSTIKERFSLNRNSFALEDFFHDVINKKNTQQRK